MVPMGDGPPCHNRPELGVARHPGTKLPSTAFGSHLSKTSDDLIHVGPLGRVFLNHIGDQWLHELKAMVFLVRGSQDFVLVLKKNETIPSYNVPEPSFLSNRHRWETGHTGSSGLDAQVRTCRHHLAVRQAVAH